MQYASCTLPTSWPLPWNFVFDSTVAFPAWAVDSIPMAGNAYVSMPRAPVRDSEFRWMLTNASARHRYDFSTRSESSSAVSSSVRVRSTSNPSARSFFATRFAMSRATVFSAVFPSFDTAPESVPPCPGSRHTRIGRPETSGVERAETSGATVSFASSGAGETDLRFQSDTAGFARYTDTPSSFASVRPAE